MAASFESGSGNGYKKFQIITILFPQIKVLFPQIKCDIKDTLRHKYTGMWRKCGQITKWPQCLRVKSVEEVFKNPHKMTFTNFFCVDFTKFRVESVETRVENPHKTHFTLQKRVKRGKSN